MRLTRRGRVVVLLLLVLVVLSLTATLAQVPSGAANEQGVPEPYETVVVRPGDTLWTLAQERVGGGDVRPVIHQIEELNGLASGRLQAGQRLLFPVGPG